MNVPRAVAGAVALLMIASTALAQTPAPGDPAPADPAGAPAAPAPDAEKSSAFRVIGRDYKRFFSADTAQVLGMAAVGSIGSVAWDKEFVEQWAGSLPDEVFEAGSVAGSFAFQLGAGALTFGIGKAVGSRSAAGVGVDLVRAQLVSQGLVQAVKYTVRRERPDGSNKVSFPSGHAASTFAAGAVLQRHFGWKGAVPGYALGAYVALSRLSENKHHLSDVIMGAGFGLAAGRTVTLDLAGHKFGALVEPTRGGAALMFTLRHSGHPIR